MGRPADAARPTTIVAGFDQVLSSLTNFVPAAYAAIVLPAEEVGEFSRIFLWAVLLAVPSRFGAGELLLVRRHTNYSTYARRALSLTGGMVLLLLPLAALSMRSAEHLIVTLLAVIVIVVIDSVRYWAFSRNSPSKALRLDMRWLVLTCAALALVHLGNLPRSSTSVALAWAIGGVIAFGPAAIGRVANALVTRHPVQQAPTLVDCVAHGVDSVVDRGTVTMIFLLSYVFLTDAMAGEVEVARSLILAPIGLLHQVALLAILRSTALATSVGAAQRWGFAVATVSVLAALSLGTVGPRLGLPIAGELALPCAGILAARGFVIGFRPYTRFNLSNRRILWTRSAAFVGSLSAALFLRPATPAEALWLLAGATLGYVLLLRVGLALQPGSPR